MTEPVQPDAASPDLVRMIAPDFSPAFRATLRAYCAAQHGRQSALARHLGVHRQEVSKWLHTTLRPGHRNTLGILDFLPPKERRKIFKHWQAPA